MADTANLCRQAFKAINNFKRHRTLSDTVVDGKDKMYHELQMYKQMDSLELTVRAIQLNERLSGEEEEGEVA